MKPEIGIHFLLPKYNVNFEWILNNIDHGCETQIKLYNVDSFYKHKTIMNKGIRH